MADNGTKKVTADDIRYYSIDDGAGCCKVCGGDLSRGEPDDHKPGCAYLMTRKGKVQLLHREVELEATLTWIKGVISFSVNNNDRLPMEPNEIIEEIDKALKRG